MCFNKLFFYLGCLGIFFSPVVFTAEIEFEIDTTVNADSLDHRAKFLASDVTLTNNSEISHTKDSGRVIQSAATAGTPLTNLTLINNNGAVIRLGGQRDIVIDFVHADDSTIINSGLLKTNDQMVILLSKTDNITVINNATGRLESERNSIFCSAGGLGACTNPTIINSGVIVVFPQVTCPSCQADKGAIVLDNSTGATIINNAGGEILTFNTTGNTIGLNDSGTFTNSGLIRALNADGDLILSDAAAVIKFNGTNTTVLLKDKGIVVGTISNSGDNAGSKLQVQHGYGRSYMYQTLGELELADLSGNRIVKGSATAVGMGAQETVDELLAQRAYNLRTTLKRYADLQNPKATIEPFAYASHRDRGRTTLRYENYAAGTNFIYPVVPDKLNLILTLERNKLQLDEDHDVRKNSFLIGVNTNDFMALGKWKASGFAAGGVSWHDSDREVLTNTVLTGITDVTAEYDTTEAITGISFTHTYDQKVNESVNNMWDTDLGLTFSFSHTPSYNESQFFTWEERNLTQLSIHIGEQLTSMLGDKAQFRLGGEFEHRSVFAGKNQDHAINGIVIDFNSGTFYENSVSMNTGFDYALGQYSKAYVQFNGRVSDQTAISLGASAGVNLIF